MSQALSSLRPLEGALGLEAFRSRAQEQTPRPAGIEPAVTAHVRPGPKPLSESGAAAALAQVQEQTLGGADMAGAHGGLDPQRVAKLLGLLD